MIIRMLGFQDHPFNVWAFLSYEISPHQLPWLFGQSWGLRWVSPSCWYFGDVDNSQPLQLSVALPFPLRKLFCGASGELCWWWMWRLAEHRSCCRGVIVPTWPTLGSSDGYLHRHDGTASVSRKRLGRIKLCYRLWWDILYHLIMQYMEIQHQPRNCIVF